MTVLAIHDAAPEPVGETPHGEQVYGPRTDREADRRKRNLETLLWLGMEIDGSATQGRMKRNRSLKFRRCREDGRE